MRKSLRLFVFAVAVLSGSVTLHAGSGALTVTSSAFKQGQTIPKKHTCAGADVSPPLAWTGVPAETKSIAIVCDDPDAPGGSWVHWVIYRIAPSTTKIGEHVPTVDALPDGAVQGLNSFGKVGYNGPCTPPDEVHRYVFTVYALDTELPSTPRLKRSELLRAIEGHVVATGTLLGKFGRR